MGKELKQMLEELKELENAKTESEVVSAFGNICGDAGVIVGRYEDATEMERLIYPEIKKIINVSYEKAKKGDKSALEYVNAAETMLNKAKMNAEEKSIESHKAAEIHKKAIAIKNRKLQEFKISN